MDNLQQQEQNTIAYSYFVDESGKLRVKSQHVLLVIIILVCLLVFHFRHKIIELHDRYRTRSRIDSGYYSNLQSFEDDVASGLSSSNFDLESNNIATNDNRAGLSESAKLQIKRSWKKKVSALMMHGWNILGMSLAKQYRRKRYLETPN